MALVNPLGKKSGNYAYLGPGGEDAGSCKWLDHPGAGCGVLGLTAIFLPPSAGFLFPAAAAAARDTSTRRGRRSTKPAWSM